MALSTGFCRSVKKRTDVSGQFSKEIKRTENENIIRNLPQRIFASPRTARRQIAFQPSPRKFSLLQSTMYIQNWIFVYNFNGWSKVVSHLVVIATCQKLYSRHAMRYYITENSFFLWTRECTKKNSEFTLDLMWL